MISDEELIEIAREDEGSDVQFQISIMAREILAYRQAFSKPFCFTDTAGVELCRQRASFEAWPHIDAVIDSIPLYRKPTIPE